MDDILTQAMELLGHPVKIDRRGWATWWCPFHPDADRAGRSKHPNFGININPGGGHWKCLRCGAQGGSIAALYHKLGKDWKRPQPVQIRCNAEQPPSQVEALAEAVSEARVHFQHSPAWGYVAGRGVSPYTALVYGLGYGVTAPAVRRATAEAARQSLLIGRSGVWLWAGGVVYADPPLKPTVINVRYIPDDRLPTGIRNFAPEKNHKTWGSRVQPLGSWRITPVTKMLVVVEGLFDMLITAQALHERGLDNVTAIYTNGASPSAAMLDWFRQHGRYEYLLLSDPDEAGLGWGRTVTKAIRDGGGQVRTVRPPDKLDPDEAILKGWWPAFI